MGSVAIVGGGASGVLAAIRLLDSEAARQGQLKVTIIESRAELGGGVAYSVDEKFFLLNVASARMGAMLEGPEDFHRWLRGAHPEELRPFVPRKLYREYLGVKLAELVARVPAGVFHRVLARALGWSYGARGIHVRLDGTDDVVADRLIVATGYRGSELPAIFRGASPSPRLIADVWRGVDGIHSNARILILGNGLTAVDFLLGLARRGHRGPIHCLSRRGLGIRPHLHPGFLAEEKLPDFAEWTPRSARLAFSDFRRAVGNLGHASAWPLLVDRVRPEVHRIWGNWSLRERARFLRHLRTWWETHRHRVSPEIAEEWEALYARGFFTSSAGRVVRWVETPEEIQVEIGEIHGANRIESFDHLVNCTGVVPDLSFFTGHSLMEDRLALGIETDVAGRPYDCAGRILEGVYVLGPALRTRFWEMTAIPEIRQQARVVSDCIQDELRKS